VNGATGYAYTKQEFSAKKGYALGGLKGLRAQVKKFETTRQKGQPLWH